MDQITSVPTRKVGSATLGGVGGGIVTAWLWNTFLGAKYGMMPAEVGAALGGLIAGISGHLTRDRSKSGQLR